MVRDFRSLATVSLLLVAACATRQPSPAPEPAETRPGRWQQDVRYVSENVARLHKDAFRRCSREAFEAAAIYAETHPPRGRPAGRPWRKAT